METIYNLKWADILLRKKKALSLSNEEQEGKNVLMINQEVYFRLMFYIFFDYIFYDLYTHEENPFRDDWYVIWHW